MFWNKNKNRKTEETKEQEESKNQVSVEENTQQEDNAQFQSIRNAEDLMKEVIDEFTKTKISYIADVRKDELSKKNFMKEVRKHLTRYYPNYEAYYDEALTLIDSYIFGYFRLTPLIEDKDITDICAATVHSESAMTALDKVVDYAKYASDYSKPELMKMVTSFKTIVYIYDFKVIEVVEIVGWDDEKREPIYKTIYREQGENKS